jgi:hypothetical protein
MPESVKIHLPEDKELAKMVMQAETQRVERSQEMGRIGGLFGSRQNAPTYIAGVVACFFALVLAAIVFLPIGEGLTRVDALQVVGGFFLAALGYLFGSITGNGKH